MLVSIVVPVYNTGKYLLKCLESIQTQSYTNIEVIVFNDGSTDNSGSIAESFCNSDNRFKYYYHNNKGQGITRNIATKLARGKYIAYVDSDDYIDKMYVEILVEKAIAEKADIVCGEMELVYPNDVIKKRYNLNNLSSINLNKMSDEDFYKNYYFTTAYSTNPVDKLYSTSLIKDNNVLFGDNKVVSSEDRLFQLQLLLYANKISFVDKPIYFYIKHDESTTGSYQKNILQKELNLIRIYEGFSSKEITQKIASLTIHTGIELEVKNIIENDLGYSSFRKILNEVREDEYFHEKVTDVINLKSYTLISNKVRKLFIIIISYLEKYKMQEFSTIFIYLINYMKEKVRSFV